MALTAWVGDRRFEIGNAPLLKAWFSTILVRLEDDNWGSSFPTIMREFYSGYLPSERAEAALKELKTIQRCLRAHSPDQVVWDFENRAARPPWGDEISARIISLGKYFVTSDGRDLLETLINVFSEAARTRRYVVIT